MENKGEIIIYQSKTGKTTLNVRLEKDTVWLSLNQIAKIFSRDKSVISRHLKNIFETGELDRGPTVAFFATVQSEGGREIERQVEHFNLDVIISVGYRVNSKVGTQFRIWATNVLKDYIVKGFAINHKRLQELENRFDTHRESYQQFHYLLSKFIMNTPRRDVMNAIIDDMEKFKEEIKSLSAKIDKIKDKDS